MSNQSLATRVHEQLRQAVDSGLLSKDVHRHALQLLGRLERPVRLGLLGMPGAGKSTILNLLVGTQVVPLDMSLPTLQLTYGETPRTLCTLPDGSNTTLETVDIDEVMSLSPVFIDMRMPLAALKKISVLEVAAPGDTAGLHRASQWAAKRCDVALWCTKGYIPTEQTIWSQMPDSIKDHGFLMLTHADLIKASGKLDIAITAVKKAAGDEFNHVLPIATPDALAARADDGTVDKEKMRESGGLALISAVLKQVDQGRQSAVDMADVLLHQNADVLGGSELSVDKQDVKPEVVEKTATQLSVVRPETVAETETVKPTPEGATNNAPEATENAVVTLHPATRETYQNALTYIANQSQSMAAIAEEAGDDAPAQVIAMTVEHVQWVCDYLNENGDDSDLALQRARDTALDAADLVQLMQMEKNDSAAIEALSLLLQIKHELQADLAA